MAGSCAIRKVRATMILSRFAEDARVNGHAAAGQRLARFVGEGALGAVTPGSGFSAAQNSCHRLFAIALAGIVIEREVALDGGEGAHHLFFADLQRPAQARDWDC